MIESVVVVISCAVAVAALAYCSFQLGIRCHQWHVMPELIKARQDNAKYQMLLKMKPRHACDVCKNGKPQGDSDSDTPRVVTPPRFDCGRCHKCHHGKYWKAGVFALGRMLACPECGNKRCPKASDHILDCTNSNETGQHGSVY